MKHSFLRWPAVFGGLLVFASIWSPAQAFRLPSWAQAIAESTSSVPDGVSKDAYRILLREHHTVVSSDGTLLVRQRLAFQALRTDATRIGRGSFPFGNGVKIRSQSAWHLPPGSRSARHAWGPPVDVTLQSGFLTEEKLRSISVLGIKKGSLVFFEYEAAVTPRVLAWSESFRETAPIVLSRVEVETPPGWTVRSTWLRVHGPDERVHGRTHIWELEDLPFEAGEPLGDHVDDLAPRLVVNVAPPPDAPTKVPAVADWAALSEWYGRRAAKAASLTPSGATAAKALFGEAGTDPLARVRVASLYVRDKVRSVDVDPGSGDYTPHNASETLACSYGDSQDKAVLLMALLSSAGIVSYPALVDTTGPETVSSDLPALDSFNRFVIAVAIPPSELSSLTSSTARVDGGELGTLMIVDPSNESAYPGDLTESLAGRQVLVLAGSRGRLGTISRGDARSHLIERRLRIEISVDGPAHVHGLMRYCGQPATTIRSLYNHSVADRRKSLEDEIRHRWAAAEFHGYGADLTLPDGCLLETIEWTLPNPPSRDPQDLPLFPISDQDVPRVSLGKRERAIVYPFPATIRYETTVTGAPPEPLPLAPRGGVGNGWVVKTEVTEKDGMLTAIWEATRERDRFEAEAFSELRAFWATLDRTSSLDLHRP